MTPREEELVARELLEYPTLVGVYFKEKRWAELGALVRFARRDVPVELAQTDPALYRQLREQITRFFLLGGDVFSLEALDAKSQSKSLSAEVKSCCSERGSPSSSGLKAPKFRLKELEGLK